MALALASPALPLYERAPREEEVILDLGPPRIDAEYIAPEDVPTDELNRLRSPEISMAFNASRTQTWPLQSAVAPSLSTHATVIPLGSPPRYNRPRAPRHAVKYSFSQLAFNSMILIPPADEPDTRPLYHISVSLNCFMPSSFITSIRRGANMEGQLVAEYQMGISSKDATVYIRGEEEYISSMLYKLSGSHKNGSWRWKVSGHREDLYWYCDTCPRLCFWGRRTITNWDKPVAKYYFSDKLRKANHPVEEPQLEVFPAGQQIFDDILLSALIIERQRLTPGGFIQRAKNMFNFTPGFVQ